MTETNKKLEEYQSKNIEQLAENKNNILSSLEMNMNSNNSLHSRLQKILDDSLYNIQTVYSSLSLGLSNLNNNIMDRNEMKSYFIEIDNTSALKNKAIVELNYNILDALTNVRNIIDEFRSHTYSALSSPDENNVNLFRHIEKTTLMTITQSQENSQLIRSELDRTISLIRDQMTDAICILNKISSN